ncbi:MAG: Xaa-Pro peptidase family protein [Bacillota bacterium]|nr:Xaa-Pro peptidase family protein [Bacillota bacterium]
MRRVLAATEAPQGGPVEGLVVTRPENRFYLTGFTGSSGYVLVSLQHALLLTDFRYTEQAAQQAPAFEVVRHGSPWFETLAERACALGLTHLGFEADHLSVADLQAMQAAVPGVRLTPLCGVVEQLRLVKEPAEIEIIARAAACSEGALRKVLESGVLRPGVREFEVAAELEHHMRQGGASRPAFDTIVASGPRSSLPHGRASDRRLAAGDFVTMDFGALVDGYCSDITRTVVIGRASPEQRRLYDLVLRAQLAGLGAVAPGAGGRAADEAARAIIRDAGHGDHFGHGLGHGVGIAIHEGPRLSPLSDSILQPGMVTSVEPGVYLPGWGGVRIEDLVAVTGDGCRVLTDSTKELIELL